MRAGFNPRAREGRDREGGTPAGAGNCFNPRAREGRDRHGGRPRQADEEVSIHAPARGATIDSLAKQQAAAEFQSTRPRGARRLPVDLLDSFASVSIHAPARGATRVLAEGGVRRAVSIHAPARGATLNTFQRKTLAPFQSTRPRGARPPNFPITEITV